MLKERALKQPTQPGIDETILNRREFPEFVLQEKLYLSNTRSPLHVHSEAILCIVLEGACEEQYERKTRQYSRYDSEFLPPHHEHSLKFYGPKTHCLSLQIQESWLIQAQEYGLRLNESVQLNGGVIMDLFMKVNREFEANDSVSYFALQGLIAEMLVHGMRHNITANTKRPRWLNQAKDLLHAQFADQLKLCAVAEDLGIHPVHLAREFRKHFGKTMGQYVRELRITQSMVELAQSQRKIAEIAIASGFADQSHFSRIFKEHTGWTPAEYRR